jgi:hypothetical protein
MQTAVLRSHAPTGCVDATQSFLGFLKGRGSRSELKSRFGCSSRILVFAVQRCSFGAVDIGNFNDPAVIDTYSSLFGNKSFSPRRYSELIGYVISRQLRGL